MPTWPLQSECLSFYGQPGTGHTSILTPWPLRLAWDKETIIHRMTIHRKCAQSALTVMDAVLDFYGLEQIQRLKLDLWGGCYANRSMRGGRALSMHAFACAIDWNPDENMLRWKANDPPPHHPTMSDPDYSKWWELWEAEGWVSLGRSADMDWMHVQAARLNGRSVKILRLGDTGEEVKKLQRLLGIKVDGFFGHDTEKSVKVYQSLNNLTVDGVAGPYTMKELADE